MAAVPAVEVVLDGPPDRAGPPAPARTGRVVLLLLGAAAVVALLGSREAPPVSAATLSVDADRVSVARTGHVVVPVEVAVRGPGLRIEEVEVTGDPLAEPASSTGATRVRADDSAGLVAILRPDCARLGDGALRARVVVRLLGEGGRVDRALDLGQAPGVAEGVAGACA